MLVRAARSRRLDQHGDPTPDPAAQPGRDVPDDVAVVGFDDSHAARLANPQLTSVRQPMEEIGRSLARLLLNEVRNPGHRSASLIVPTELIIRESS